MEILSRLFGGKTRPLDESGGNDQAVIVYLEGTCLPKDLAPLEDQLIQVIEKRSLGDFDGNEIGKDGTVLYMHGRDAEKLFSGIESALRAYPLCQNARVLIRRGGPGAPEREVRIPRR